MITIELNKLLKNIAGRGDPLLIALAVGSSPSILPVILIVD